MSLTKHLQFGTPLIWVNTDEPERIVDDVILTVKRKVFRLDPFEGLVVWQNEKWCRVLVELQDGSEGPTYDFQAAFGKVYQDKGVFIIPNAHLMAKDFLHMFAGLYDKYRYSYNENRSDTLPCQLVLISCTGEIPPEIARHVAIVSQDVLRPEGIAHLVLKLKDSIDSKDILPETKELPKITKAAIGLSEAELMQSLLLSVEETGVIDPGFINDFKLQKIKSGGVLEVRNPTIGLDDIGGLDNAKELIHSLEWAWNNPAEAESFGVVPIRRILMIGVPGTGKSAICEAVAKTLDLELAKFGVSSMMNKFIGESERNMRMAFQQIKAMAPLVCWGDELGRDLSGSGSANDAGTTDRVHGEFLTGLQELPDNVIFMAAANAIDGIPPEMLRADRFDKIMFVGFPSMSEREEIFRIHLGESWVEFDLQSLAEVTTMFTGAEIKALIKEAKSMISYKEKRSIATADLVALAPNIKNRIWIKHRSVMVNMYSKALVEWDWASSDQRMDAEYILSGKAESTTTNNMSFTKL